MLKFEKSQYMKKILFSVVFTVLLTNVKSQTYVTIPDAQFVNWLQANYPAAMNGNQMNINSSAITGATMVLLNSKNISNLSGIEHFTSLSHLECSLNNLSTLPQLPNSLQYLWCRQNPLTSISSFPSGLITLNVGANWLTSLPSLPPSLKYFRCDGNNQLASMPPLPPLLDSFSCANCSLTTIPALPNNLTFFECNGNWMLSSLPTLPQTLQHLNCNNTGQTSLPVLPGTLMTLDCAWNLLISLPSLPNSLSYLACGYNNLQTLPSLPNSLSWLSCQYNELTSLPQLPPALQVMDCDSNHISCFPPFPNSLTYLDISLNPFCCLPNYLPIMDAVTLGYPLCATGNTTGCPVAGGVLGYTYLDNNNNCIKDGGDFVLKNVPVKLYDQSNNLIDQTISAANGVYNFAKSNATYKVEIDTNNIPYQVQCGSPGLDSLVLVNGLDTGVNFSFTCKPGFDIGVQSITRTGVLFPGQPHTLNINAGGISNWYGGNCASGISGQLQVTVAGNVSYVAPALGALTPTVVGNVYTYSITDFGLVNPTTDFRLSFKADTTAQAGDTVCVSAVVTPTNGDINVNNNTFESCNVVANSHDPNIKEVYPIDVPLGYNDWLTYTIHFQNTGNAPAFNIRLADTLDVNLDLSTFQVTGYSHPNNTYLNGNLLSVYFPNIMLPDSTSDPNGSIGYVQYRLKPKSTWAFPVQIKNTAYIYFDFNAPIVTNTTVNSFQTAVGVKEMGKVGMKIYPNPSNGIINIESDITKGEMIITDVLGTQVQKEKFTGREQIDISAYQSGVYFIQIKTQGLSYIGKFIKE